jgi:hypothetical protein
MNIIRDALFTQDREGNRYYLDTWGNTLDTLIDHAMITVIGPFEDTWKYTIGDVDESIFTQAVAEIKERVELC